MPKFIGKISQIPPKFSAKSVNGVRAYEMARKNIEFELKPKMVKIYDIKLVDYNAPTLTLEIECGSGTYIRSIGRDIALELNSLATMTKLTRTKIGKFNLNNCHNIQDVENIEEYILPVKDVLDIEKLEIPKEDRQKILNGRTIEIPKINGIYSLEDELDTVALVEIRNKIAKMSVFLG